MQYSFWLNSSILSPVMSYIKDLLLTSFILRNILFAMLKYALIHLHHAVVGFTPLIHNYPAHPLIPDNVFRPSLYQTKELLR